MIWLVLSIGFAVLLLAAILSSIDTRLNKCERECAGVELAYRNLARNANQSIPQWVEEAEDRVNENVARLAVSLERASERGHNADLVLAREIDDLKRAVFKPAKAKKPKRPVKRKRS